MSTPGNTFAASSPATTAAKTLLTTALLTTLAMVAFAANSLLCRMALGAETMDAASFTTLRLLSGAITLVLIVRASRPTPVTTSGDWRAATWLFLYAAAFSFALRHRRTSPSASVLRNHRRSLRPRRPVPAWGRLERRRNSLRPVERLPLVSLLSVQRQRRTAAGPRPSAVASRAAR